MRTLRIVDTRAILRCMSRTTELERVTLTIPRLLLERIDEQQDLASARRMSAAS